MGKVAHPLESAASRQSLADAVGIETGFRANFSY